MSPLRRLLQEGKVRKGKAQRRNVNGWNVNGWSVPRWKIPSGNVLQRETRGLKTLALLLAIVSGVLLGSGCTITQPLPDIDNWDNYQTRLSQLENWKLQGKLGLRLPDDANSVYVDWRQAPRDYAIRLSGPLGQGTTWIRGSDSRVRLEQAGQEPLSAATPEELVHTALGWDLPISDLFYWVRGIPAPQSRIASQEKTEAGALAFLEQAGWQLTYSRYNAVGPWQLPGKIVARRDNLKLTLVIKQWEVPEN